MRDKTLAELVSGTTAADRVTVARSSGSSRQLLPACKPGVQVMPVQDLWFIELPAQIRFAAVNQRWEIDQSFLAVLWFQAELREFFNIIAEAPAVLFQFFFDLDEFFTVYIGRLAISSSQQVRQTVAAIDDIARKLSQILYDRPYERKHGVCPLDSKVLAICLRVVSHKMSSSSY